MKFRRVAFTVVVCLMTVAGVVLVVITGFSWLDRGTRTVALASVGGGGDLYVVEESHSGAPRFHLFRYDQSKEFEEPEVVPVSMLPGCGDGDSVVIEELAYSEDGVAILGRCSWSDEAHSVWRYRQSENEFHIVESGLDGDIDEMAVVSAENFTQVYVTELAGSDRFCSSLFRRAGADNHEITLSGAQGVFHNCSAGVWSMSTDPQDGLLAHVRSNSPKGSMMCLISDSDSSSLNCEEIGNVVYGDCEFNPYSGVYLCFTRVGSGVVADVYDMEEPTKLLASGVDLNGDIVVPMSATQVLVVKTGSVDVVEID